MQRGFLLCIASIVTASAGCITVSPPSVRWVDDAIVYQPSRYPDGVLEPHGLNYEDANFTADDGTELHGWFCPCENPRAVVLFAHGNAGNVSHRADRLRLLQRDLHVACMTFDYRGYGRSEGLPTETGVLLDARAARKWLAVRTGVREQEIVLMGESLGGGVAVDLAAKDGAAGLILESTFTSLPEAAQKHVPYLPTKFLMRNRLNSLSKIGNYQGPLLIAHGDADDLIPLDHAKRLHEAASGPKELVVIPGGGHNWQPTPEYKAQLDQFFAKQLAARTVATR
jgi:fermentation-respiration switch protein FrsA (DUF1100 family)